MLQAPPGVPDVGGVSVDCSKDGSSDQEGEAQMKMVRVSIKSPAPPLCSLKDVKKWQCVQDTQTTPWQPLASQRCYCNCSSKCQK